MSKLVLQLKSEYFHAIKRMEKPEEFREDSAYWRSRLLNDDGTPKEFESVVFINAYRGGAENRIEVPYIGFTMKEILHPHFGVEKLVRVFAIPTMEVVS